MRAVYRQSGLTFGDGAPRSAQRRLRHLRTPASARSPASRCLRHDLVGRRHGREVRLEVSQQRTPSAVVGGRSVQEHKWRAAAGLADGDLGAVPGPHQRYRRRLVSCHRVPPASPDDSRPHDPQHPERTRRIDGYAVHAKRANVCRWRSPRGDEPKRAWTALFAQVHQLGDLLRRLGLAAHLLDVVDRPPPAEGVELLRLLDTLQQGSLPWRMRQAPEVAAERLPRSTNSACFPSFTRQAPSV